MTRRHKAMWIAVHMLPPELIPLAAAEVTPAAAPIATAVMSVQAAPVGMHAHAPPAYSESAVPGGPRSAAHGVQLTRVAPAPWSSPASPAPVAMDGSGDKSHTQAQPSAHAASAHAAEVEGQREGQTTWFA